MRTSRSAQVDIVLDRTAPEPLYQQIYQRLRDAIVAGALREGDLLPTTRSVASGLEVARCTVERAYSQLAVEGYVDAVARSGHRVRRLQTAFLQSAAAPREAPHVKLPARRVAFFEEFEHGPDVPYDFAFARLAPGSFPVKTWLRLEQEVLHYADDDLLGNYPLEHRPSALQRELARYLRRTRGVVCAPEQVVVLPSTDVALTTLLGLFDPGRHRVGCEEPGYTGCVEVARRLGFSVDPLPVDRGDAAFLDALRTAGSGVAFVTPSHQFPTGAVMPLSTRAELLSWANANDVFLIEDDSCNEYRYDTDPVPSLSSLDAQGRVCYLGNFSKTLCPGLRVAYAVVPERLLERYFDRFWSASTAVSLITQEVLARFIATGAMDQQVRKMVAAGRQRHDRLLSCLRQGFGDRIALQGTNAGLHFCVGLPNGMSEDELVSSARAQGAQVYRSSIYRCSGRPYPPQVIVGFSAIDPDEVAPGVQALVRAWG